MKEWETHIEIIFEQENEIDADEAIDTYVFDRETFETTYCKAIISKDTSKVPEHEKLWVRNFKGQMEEEPWAIKMLEIKNTQTMEA